MRGDEILPSTHLIPIFDDVDENTNGNEAWPNAQSVMCCVIFSLIVLEIG